MQLYIVRHGIAIDREDPKCPADPERYLTEEGIEKTEQAAEGAAALGATADVFLSSPYLRATQTAEIFARALNYSQKKILKTEALLPGSDPTALFRDLAKDKQSVSVFCFGHAPQLDELIAVALGLKNPITALKKAGVALLDLKRISPPNGQLLWLAVPKLLRRAGK
jgi:phosphohistidine phosphatase